MSIFNVAIYILTLMKIENYSDVTGYTPFEVERDNKSKYYGKIVIKEHKICIFVCIPLVKKWQMPENI